MYVSIITFLQIDRSLKSNILKKDLKHIDDVLEAENEIMESSLEFEKKEYELEKEWENIRLRRENEINEEMRQQVLQREEALLSELEKLNLENKKQEHENEELLKQLDEMKTQLQKKDEDFILAEKLRMNTGIVSCLSKSQRKLPIEVGISRKSMVGFEGLWIHNNQAP